MKTTVEKSSISPIDIFLKGETRLRAEHKAKEKDKVGVLRVGNAGCLLSDNTTLGACLYATLARFLGKELNSEAAQAYFDGGLLNEEIWTRNLTASGVSFRCEEDIPVVHQLTESVKVTGRPDVVIGSSDEQGVFVPELGVELKSTQSTNSAAKKMLLHEPDEKHLIQAATYSMFMGIPFTLVYTNNMSGGIESWFTSKAAGSKIVKEGKIEFPIGWSNGTMYYVTQDGCRQFTKVTQQGILNFYRLVAEMAQQKELVQIKKSTQSILGEDLPYDPNDYNDFTLMVSPNTTFDIWFDNVSKACAQDLVIKYTKKQYKVVDIKWLRQKNKYVKIEEVIDSFPSVEQARNFIFGV